MNIIVCELYQFLKNELCKVSGIETSFFPPFSLLQLQAQEGRIRSDVQANVWGIGGITGDRTVTGLQETVGLLIFYSTLN